LADPAGRTITSTITTASGRVITTVVRDSSGSVDRGVVEGGGSPGGSPKPKKKRNKKKKEVPAIGADGPSPRVSGTGPKVTLKKRDGTVDSFNL
jgi:hypothetical protein